MKRFLDLFFLFIVLGFSSSAAGLVVYSNDFSDGAASIADFIVDGKGTYSVDVVSGQLQIDTNLPCPCKGYIALHTSHFVAPYSSILQNNPGLISWSFNISNRDKGYGYNNGFLIGLASSAADARYFSSTAYYFAGGFYVGNRMMLARTGTYAETPIIDITVGLPPLPSKGSFRITYDPSTHLWSLYGEIGASYIDPETVTDLLGSVTDSTHTGEDLPYIYIGGSTPGTVFLDNFTVSVIPATPPHEPSIIYVDDDATGANNGSSWTNAYKYLQDSLSAALSGDEIWVAQGTYNPDRGGSNMPGNREATFQLKNGVTLKGGYAGNAEPEPNARNLELYKTTLSGDLAGNDLDTIDPCELLSEPTRSENSYHVVTAYRTDNSAVLSGFIITAGNADNYSVAYHGGGIFNRGLYIEGQGPVFDGPTLEQCTIIRNSAAGEGGGMHNASTRQTQIIDCVFAENMALWGGGAIKNDVSNSIITKCLFEKNRSVGYYHTSGAAVDNEESSPVFTNCIFNENSANYGGAVANWMGNNNPTFINCLFTNNSAQYGGAMWCSNHFFPSSPKFYNCTLADNTAVYGNALACTQGSHDKPPSNLELTNCILWDGGDEIWNDDGSTISITYSDVKAGWLGTGNFDADPCFVDPVNGDYHLLQTSPCINAGDPNHPYDPNETDLDGNPRIIDGRIDMGALEYLPPLEARLLIMPRTINRKSRQRHIMAWLSLPAEVTRDDIDENVPLTLYPGDIEASRQFIFQNNRYDRTHTFILAFFKKSDLMNAVPEDGQVQLEAVGQLNTGRYFFGQHTVRIINPPHRRPNPNYKKDAPTKARSPFD